MKPNTKVQVRKDHHAHPGREGYFQYKVANRVAMLSEKPEPAKPQNFFIVCISDLIAPEDQ